MFVYMSSGTMAHSKLLLQRLVRIKLTPKRSLSSRAQRLSTAGQEHGKRRSTTENSPLGVDMAVAFLSSPQLQLPPFYLHKTEPLNISSWKSEGLTSPTSP